MNFLITNLQKYDPYTFIFDLGGSFESLTRLFGGTYVRVGARIQPSSRSIPFACPKRNPISTFWPSLSKCWPKRQVGLDSRLEEEQEIYQQIENLYSVDPELRTLGVLANTLPRSLSLRLQKWTEGGQFGFLFDNAEDTVSFSQFQCFDFQGMERLPADPGTAAVLHPASRQSRSSRTAKSRTYSKPSSSTRRGRSSATPRIKRYIVEALKTWRKQNAAMMLSTQSLDELRKSDILDVIVETCATKIFLANPDMDRELVQEPVSPE